jgi:hypothetical protein
LPTKQTWGKKADGFLRKHTGAAQEKWIYSFSLRDIVKGMKYSYGYFEKE